MRLQNPSFFDLQRTNRWHPVVLVLASVLACAALCCVFPALAKEKTKKEPPPQPPKITFTDPCAAGEQFVIAAVGDVLVHESLQKQAMRNKLHFRSLWQHIAPNLAAADLTYGNLEGPSAPGIGLNGKKTDPGFVFDNSVYTGYPRFNYHPNLLLDLAADGFDVVSTANNHGSDRGSDGVDLTIESVKAAGIVSAGTRDAAETIPWHAETEARGLRVAWVACTKHINGMANSKQVMPCYAEFGEDSTDTNPLVIQTVKDLAARPDIDAVIVTPHFGKSHKLTPNEGQITFAHNVLDAGALAVIGNHVHNLQPWEQYTTPDGRETFVMYSLGNFVSTMAKVEGHATALLYLGLKKRADTGKVVLNGVRFLPLYMSSRDGAHGVEALSRLPQSTQDLARPFIASFIGEDNFIDIDDPLTLAPECTHAP